LNQILKRQTSRFHYGSKAPAVAITVSKYRNKTAVKAVPYPAKQTSKTFLRKLKHLPDRYNIPGTLKQLQRIFNSKFTVPELSYYYQN
jgi:hypothetical protein